MTDTITITGLVATVPRHLVTTEGLSITSFRLASTQRRFDRSHERWVDGDTNWYTITTFRQLAINAAGSVSKGDRVVATGRLRIRDWENGERAGTNVDIEADALGHDLSWGTSSFSRTIATAAVDAASPSRSGDADGFPTGDGADGPDAHASADADASDTTAADTDDAKQRSDEDRVALPF
jgi:single-strand DNA-binding protein